MLDGTCWMARGIDTKTTPQTAPATSEPHTGAATHIVKKRMSIAATLRNSIPASIGIAMPSALLAGG